MSDAPAKPTVVWMAPHAADFAPGASIVVKPQRAEMEQLEGLEPTTIVVSAQDVTRDFLAAWKAKVEGKLTLIRRGTSLTSIDLEAAKELGVEVQSTPGVNSPHVALFVLETLGLGGDDAAAVAKAEVKKAVVLGAGSVGKYVIQGFNKIGVKPFVKDREADGAVYGVAPEQATFCQTLEEAFAGATHIAVCASLDGRPIIADSAIDALLEGLPNDQVVKIVSPSRPDVMAMDALLRLPANVQIRFDYGASVLAPTQAKIEEAGGRPNVTWSSIAMGSEACKRDMDAAVLKLLA